MRESSRKNLKIIWFVTILFGLISGGILVSFAISHDFIWLLPICPFLIVLMYYLSLYFKYKSYSIIYNKKGYDTAMLYMDPFYVLYEEPDKKSFGRVHNKHYFSLGVLIPKFKIPENDKEFETLKKNFTFSTFESIAGSLLLLVLSCLGTYFLFVYIFSDMILFCVDVVLIFLILFSSTQILFTIIEGNICLGIPNDKIDSGEVDEEGHHIIKHVLTEEQYDYLLACKMLIYGSYNKDNKNIKKNYLLKKISDYLNKDLTIDDISKDDIYIVDFVLRDYLDAKFGRLNVGYSRYINYLYDNYEEIVVNKTSPLKEDIKDYLIICYHMICYYVKRKDLKKANELLDKLLEVQMDEDKNKDLVYLRNKSMALLKRESRALEDVLKDEDIVYNGLDIFSKVTEDYVQIEKDYVYLTETKANRDKVRREREQSLLAKEEENKDIKEKDNASKGKGLFKKRKNKSDQSLDSLLEEDNDKTIEDEANNEDNEINKEEASCKDLKEDKEEDVLQDGTTGSNDDMLDTNEENKKED